MEEVLGLRETGEFLPDLVFYMGSVAPREELIKLVFLLPFLPVLIIRRSPLETLVISGCVGLGFAIEGNLQIYQHGGPSEAFGRLLTANFFHFATTGLLGLSFCRLLFAPFQRFTGFIVTLFGVVFAHGVYDAFMNIEGIGILTLGSMLSFFIVSQVVFHQLRHGRDRSTDQLFLAATLVVSLTVLAGTTLVCASMEIGFQHAVSAMMAHTIALAVVVVVFFRQLGRKLSQIADEFLTPAVR
jgi:protease PrsW